MWLVDLPGGIPAPDVQLTKVQRLRAAPVPDPAPPNIQGITLVGTLPNVLSDLGVMFNLRTVVKGSPGVPPRVAVFGARNLPGALRILASQVSGMAALRYHDGVLTLSYLRQPMRVHHSWSQPYPVKACGWKTAPDLVPLSPVQSPVYPLSQKPAVPVLVKSPVRLQPRPSRPDPRTVLAAQKVRYGYIPTHYVGPMDQAIKKLLSRLGWKVVGLGTPRVIPTVALFGPMQPSGILRTIEEQTKQVAAVYYNGVDRVVTIVYRHSNG